MEDDGAAPRWLDAGEQETWQALIGVLIRLPAALDAQLRRDAGITHFDYQVLSGLSQVPGQRMGMSELAQHTESSLPRLSQVVRRLEDRGWVRRTAHPVDGRCTLAELTDDGWAKIQQAAPGHVAAVRQLVFDQITQEQAGQLQGIGGAIMAAIGVTKAKVAS